jgi:Ribbon-helix-helix protein, copG family
MVDRESMSKHKVTIELTRETLDKLRELAGRRATSISALVEDQIQLLADEAYERAQRQAETLLERGFYLGGVRKATREDLHSR